MRVVHIELTVAVEYVKGVDGHVAVAGQAGVDWNCDQRWSKRQVSAASLDSLGRSL
jgi:hypothetical protein